MQDIVVASEIIKSSCHDLSSCFLVAGLHAPTFEYSLLGVCATITDPVKGEFKEQVQNIIASSFRFVSGSRGRKPHFVRLTVEGGNSCFLLFRKHSASSNL